MLVANWWSPVVRGFLAILFGIIALAIPGITLLWLVLLFGAYAIVEGIMNIVGAVRHRGAEQRWWASLIEGIVSVAAGVIAFVWPGLTALSLLFIIAAWAVFTGVLEIITAIRVRKMIKGEWVLGLSGALSIAFGLLLVASPGPGLLALVWLIGAYAIAFGALLMIFGFRLRSLGQVHTRPQFA